MEGQWTGGVTTTVKQSLLTIPVLAIYKVSKRWELELGPWFSYLTSGEFFGTAYDGYIRDVDPTGEKVNVLSATYDFSPMESIFAFERNWECDMGNDVYF